MNEDVRKSLREAFKAASEPHPTAEAYDWQTTPVPRRWSVGTFDRDGEGASGGTAKVKVE